MIYFNQEAHTPRTVEEARQWLEVLQFRQECEKWLYWDYKDQQDFKVKVRRHLEKLIGEYAGGKLAR